MRASVFGVVLFHQGLVGSAGRNPAPKKKAAIGRLLLKAISVKENTILLVFLFGFGVAPAVT